MRRICKVGLCPKQFPKVILLTEPKFHFSTANGTGVIKNCPQGLVSIGGRKIVIS